MNKTPKSDGAPGAQPMLTAAEIEAKFDAGEDVSAYVDWGSGVWVDPDEPTPGPEQALEAEVVAPLGETGSSANPTKTGLVQVALPAWAYNRLRVKASQQGISQEDLAQQFIVRQLEQEKLLS